MTYEKRGVTEITYVVAGIVFLVIVAIIGIIANQQLEKKAKQQEAIQKKLFVTPTPLPTTTPIPTNTRAPTQIPTPTIRISSPSATIAVPTVSTKSATLTPTKSTTPSPTP